MGQHHRAKLGPAGRAQLVSVINAGATFRAAVNVTVASPCGARVTDTAPGAVFVTLDSSIGASVRLASLDTPELDAKPVRPPCR